MTGDRREASKGEGSPEVCISTGTVAIMQSELAGKAQGGGSRPVSTVKEGGGFADKEVRFLG